MTFMRIELEADFNPFVSNWKTFDLFFILFDPEFLFLEWNVVPSRFIMLLGLNLWFKAVTVQL